MRPIPAARLCLKVLSASQVNDWMEDLLFSCSEDLFRFKGVLAIDGWPDRFIFQVCSQQVPSAFTRLSCSLLHLLATGIVIFCIHPSKSALFFISYPKFSWIKGHIHQRCCTPSCAQGQHLQTDFDVHAWADWGCMRTCRACTRCSTGRPASRGRRASATGAAWCSSGATSTSASCARASPSA